MKNLILSPSAILTKLSDVWSDNISSFLKDNGASSWETDVMNDSEFTAEIIELLDNKIFQPINCYMGRITSDPLSFSLLLDHKGNDNYSFSRYKEKLSIWLARYLNVQSLTSSPHSRVMLWGWLKNKMGVSRNNPSSEPVVTVFAAIPSIRNQCLCIGTMNRLIFWVFKPEKKLKKGQKCTFNTDNHITLQLPHLSSINFSKKSDEVTYAIMTQALAQTNTPEDIASFFLHPSMDNLAKKTKWIIKKLSTQLANKLTYNGNDFRTSLCECICSKVLASNASDVSKETLGWLIDTPLLEPVLLHINAGRMDTTPITQSLNSWEIHSFSEDGIKRLLAVEKCCHLFQQACGLDQREIALRLLWTGNCDLVAHCTNPKGEYPLIFFASNGVSSGVKYLLERCSADVNVEDELGNTPLIYAISKRKKGHP